MKYLLIGGVGKTPLLYFEFFYFTFLYIENIKKLQLFCFFKEKEKISILEIAADM